MYQITVCDLTIWRLIGNIELFCMQRNAAWVEWKETNKGNAYRIGHKGKVSGQGMLILYFFAVMKYTVVTG